MGFERWTERARQVVVLAQQAARDLKHNYIGTEHVLIGLLNEEEGLAARVLESMGLTATAVKADVQRIIGLGETAFEGQIPFTPRSQKVFEFALREALSLGHNYIGTEHVLLGLIRENEGVGARILLEHDLDSEKVRNEVVRLLSGPTRRRPKQEDYRWIVTVTPQNGTVRTPYSREVTTDGPKPDQAIRKALDRIMDAKNDLWQASDVRLTVERVR